MLLAKVAGVHLRGMSRDEMSLSQHDFDTALRSCTAAAWDGNIMAVLAQSEDEAATRLAQQLRQYLGARLRSLRLDSADFVFEIRYNSIVNQQVWLSLSTLDCKRYRGDHGLPQEQACH